MENRLNSIREYFEEKGAVCEMSTAEVGFWHGLPGRISTCRMVVRPTDTHLEVIARLPFRVKKDEYGNILYALMNLNRMLVRGGFELEPDDDSVRFRVCVMGRGVEQSKEPERVGKAVEYCDEILGRFDTRLMEILSDRTPIGGYAQEPDFGDRPGYGYRPSYSGGYRAGWHGLGEDEKYDEADEYDKEELYDEADKYDEESYDGYEYSRYSDAEDDGKNSSMLRKLLSLIGIG